MICFRSETVGVGGCVQRTEVSPFRTTAKKKKKKKKKKKRVCIIHRKDQAPNLLFHSRFIEAVSSRYLPDVLSTAASDGSKAVLNISRSYILNHEYAWVCVCARAVW